MLNTNLSPNTDGKLKELPLEARHTICLEVARKRRQSVASSIFIPKEISEKLRVPKSTAAVDKAASPPRSAPHKTTSLPHSRKLSSKLERKMKHKYYKLARGLNIPKHSLPNAPTTSLKHPESFPILRQTVTSRNVRCIVESLRDGKIAEVPTTSADQTDDEGKQPPADRLPHMPALEEVKQKNSTSTAVVKESPPPPPPLPPPEAGNGSYSATLATEPYVITVDLSGVQLDDYAKAGLKRNEPCRDDVDGRSNSNDQCRPTACHAKCEQFECALPATGTSCALEKSYKSHLALLEGVCPNAHTDATNYNAHRMECTPQHLADATIEKRMTEQVIDLSSRSLYKMPPTNPAFKTNLLPTNYIRSLAVPEQTAKSSLKNDTIQPTRIGNPAPAIHSSNQFISAKAHKSVSALWNGYTSPQAPQRELHYLNVPAQTMSPYQRTVPVPFETPPVSPQEPQWPPARHYNAHDFEHAAWYNAKAAAHQLNLPYAAQHSPPNNAYPPALEPNAPPAAPNFWSYAGPAQYALHNKSRHKQTHKMSSYVIDANETVTATHAPAYSPPLSMSPNMQYATPPPQHVYSRPLDVAPNSPALYAEHYASLPCCRNVFPPPQLVPHHYAAYHPYTLAHQLSPGSPKAPTAQHKSTSRRLRSPNWFRSAAININGYLVDVLHPALRPV